MTSARLALIVLIAFAAAAAGALIGRQLIAPAAGTQTEFHETLHAMLALDAEQQRRLQAHENAFAARRRALEAEMRAENARLAAAIAAEHGNGPRVTAAVDASHRTMGALQKETLAHMFAMRAVLRPHQAAKFDAAITKALTEDAR